MCLETPCLPLLYKTSSVMTLTDAFLSAQSSSVFSLRVPSPPPLVVPRPTSIRLVEEPAPNVATSTRSKAKRTSSLVLPSARQSGE